MAVVECYCRGTQDGAWGTVDSTALYDKAFRAVNYIANCEHANGGFRYSCGTFPDTSATDAGPVWSTWSDAMEAYLVDTRESQGHVRGS